MNKVNYIDGKYKLLPTSDTTSYGLYESNGQMFLVGRGWQRNLSQKESASIKKKYKLRYGISK